MHILYLRLDDVSLTLILLSLVSTALLLVRVKGQQQIQSMKQIAEQIHTRKKVLFKDVSCKHYLSLFLKKKNGLTGIFIILLCIGINLAVANFFLMYAGYYEMFCSECLEEEN